MFKWFNHNVKCPPNSSVKKKTRKRDKEASSSPIEFPVLNENQPNRQEDLNLTHDDTKNISSRLPIDFSLKNTREKKRSVSIIKKLSSGGENSSILLDASIFSDPSVNEVELNSYNLSSSNKPIIRSPTINVYSPTSTASDHFYLSNITNNHQAAATMMATATATNKPFQLASNSSQALQQQQTHESTLKAPIIQQPQSILMTSPNDLSSNLSSTSSASSSTSSSTGAPHTSHLQPQQQQHNNASLLSVPNKQTTSSSTSYLDDSNLKMAIVDFADVFKLVRLQATIDYHEWLAFNTKMYFDQINMLYGAIADTCTLQTCPTMSAPGNTHYHWLDEKNKKFKYSASQYIDTVLTYSAKIIGDENLFPTKCGHPFPSNFETLVRKLHKHYFQIMAHMYHSHYKELLQLKFNTYLNSIYFHFYLFSKCYGLLDDKELDVLEPLNKSLMSKYQLNNASSSTSLSSVSPSSDAFMHHVPTIHHASSTATSNSSTNSGSITSSGFSFLKKKLNFNLMA